MGPPAGRHEQPTADEIVALAWRLVIAEAAAKKSSSDPAGVPCLDCGREVDWCARRCRNCGAEYCEETIRHRARLYEGLLFGS